LKVNAERLTHQLLSGSTVYELVPGAVTLDPNGAVLLGHPPQAPPLIISPQPFSKITGDASAIRTATDSIFTVSFIVNLTSIHKLCNQGARDLNLITFCFIEHLQMLPL
jgi:hypothetical protein